MNLSIFRAITLGTEPGPTTTHLTPFPARRLLSPLSRVSAVVFLLLTGCAHRGPKTVPADRFDYSSAIADSWIQQTLLNIVTTRYMDLPVFLDVASVVAGYSLETSVSAGGQLSSCSAIQGHSLRLEGAGCFTDRPPISPVRLTGKRSLFAGTPHV